MKQLGVIVKQRLFGIDSSETTVRSRGFDVPDANVRERLESVGATFVHGYNLALKLESGSLRKELDDVPQEFRGFAFEGAAMGLALQDAVPLCGKNRFSSFAEHYGDAHIYMLHVGAGWILGRLPWLKISTFRRSFDPMLGWMVLDGYGFHEGYFHYQNTVERQRRPRILMADEESVFDQGLGRSLWFSQGASVDRIAETIHRFEDQRHADLWSGIGLAATYAGSIDEASLRRLKVTSAEYFPALAQGAVFACKARIRAGNPVEHTRLAATTLCGCSVEEVASLSDKAYPSDYRPDDSKTNFQTWREGIQAYFHGERHPAQIP